MEFEEYEKTSMGARNFFKACIGINRTAKIRFGIITVSILVVLTLLIKFVYNPTAGSYVAKWNYDVYQLNDKIDTKVTAYADGSSFKETKEDKRLTTYMDGSSFKVKDLYSKATLESIVKANPELDGINIYKMFDDDDITVTMVISENDNGLTNFELSVKQKYFKNKSQVKQLVEAIANLPIDKTKTLISNIDNEVNLRTFKNYSTSYDDQINALVTQSTFILESYNALIEKYKDRLVPSLDKTVSELIKKATYEINSLNLSYFKVEADNNHYVYQYDTYLASLVSKKNQYTEDLAIVNKKIEALHDNQISPANDESLLANLLVEKVDLECQIEKLNLLINEGNTADTTAFDAKLNNAYTKLKALTDELTTSQKEIYSMQQEVFFESNSVVSTAKSIGTILSLAISLIIGVLAAVAVNLVLDYNKFKQQVLAEKASSTTTDDQKTKAE